MTQTRRSVLTLLAAAGLAVSLAACGQPAAPQGTPSPAAAKAITVTHTQGTTELAAIPQRIVVMDFGALDTLRSVGMADKVVGVPQGAAVPKEAGDLSGYANVGTMFEPDYEAINKLNPDLVIVGFRSAKTFPEMSKHFKTIDVTYTQDKPFYDSVAYASGIIGTATGTTAKVKAKLAELKTAIDQGKAKNTSGATAMVAMTTAGKVTLQGKVSRYGVIHNDLGFAEAIKDSKEAAHGDPISFEAIQKANPGWLFVVDRDAAVGQAGQAAAKVLDNELVASTDAWKNKHVVYLTGSRWYIIIHGLDNAIAMVNEVTAAL